MVLFVLQSIFERCVHGGMFLFIKINCVLFFSLSRTTYLFTSFEYHYNIICQIEHVVFPSTFYVCNTQFFVFIIA